MRTFNEKLTYYLDNVTGDVKDQMIRCLLNCHKENDVKKTWGFVRNQIDEFDQLYTSDDGY